MNDIGPTGIAGAAGAAGAPGVKGDPGVAGAAGQPGAAGAVGADGAVGQIGDIGRTGRTGDTGDTGTAGAAGARGPAGDNTRAIKITDRRLLFMVVAMLVIFGLLAFLIQNNQRDIARNASEQCHRSVVNTTRINATNTAFVRYLKGLPQTADLLAFERIYQHSMLVVPTCG